MARPVFFRHIGRNFVCCTCPQDSGQSAPSRGLLKEGEMKFLRFFWFALVLVLSACWTAPVVPLDNKLFSDQNAWKGEIPAGAQQVSPEEFQRAISAGEMVVSSDATIAQQADARNKQFQEDKRFLQALTDKPAYVQELLAKSANLTNFDGDKRVNLPNGQKVVVFGLSNQLREAAETAKLAQSTDNSLSDFGLSYSLLPDGLKAQLPTPESLNGKSLGEVQAALTQLNALLGTPPGNASIRSAHLEKNEGKLSAQAIVAGDGTDLESSCTAPSNLVAQFWFPLKSFISPMKRQANRGVCWAFAAIGAVESRERVQNNNRVDLSEQFLVNKVKQDWDDDDYNDGYRSTTALNTAADKGQALLPESGWTYNPSNSRGAGNDDDAASFGSSCDNYKGTCSDTTHQSRRFCTRVILKFCGYATATFGGPGVTSSRTTLIWKSGGKFELDKYRNYLAGGQVILASLSVYRGFMDDVKADGVVSNYSKTSLDASGKEISGSSGGHAVQIVGFLSNLDMSRFGNTPKIGGGGYFIVKNSWGCGSGDGGYYYVPADYVEQNFKSLDVLNFDARRSDAWNKEQATPGSTEAPQIQIITNPARVDVRVETNLASFFKVTHSVAGSINLTVTSSVDGMLYNGPWSTSKNVIVGSDLKRTFAAQGPRTLTLVANYAGNQSQASLTVNAVNTAPTLSLQFGATANQGVAFPITAIVGDINEPDPSALCNNTTWVVDAPDTLSSTTGCSVSVTFSTIGSRQVRVSTRDREGLITSSTRSLAVQPPPANPNPTIGLTQIFARGATFPCGNTGVADGATIDLSQRACVAVGRSPLTRYFAQVLVGNPSNETLTYDWKLHVGSGAGETVHIGNPISKLETFDLYTPFNAGETTSACRVTVTVNAPEASRSKGPITVWTGRCTYNTFRLN
jgi:Papain family cysteine protease